MKISFHFNLLVGGGGVHHTIYQHNDLITLDKHTDNSARQYCIFNFHLSRESFGKAVEGVADQLGYHSLKIL